MNIPVISDMVHHKIGERLLKYTVDGQKFVNECGGSVATTTPYTFVSNPSSMPDGVSLVHIVIQKGQDRLQKSWAYNWQREQFEDWSLRLNRDIIYDGGVPSTVQGNLDMLTKMNIPELITFCGKK